jgi:2-iminobutanoate/2-iminopropanoate deaminase
MTNQTGTRPKREVISKALSPSLPFSKVIGYGDLVFVSGLVGRHPETGEIAPDITAQTKQVLENIRRELELAGTSLDKVLKSTVFIIDMSLFETMNEAYRSFFPTDRPARSCVEVASLPDKDALVEIEVIAGR